MSQGSANGLLGKSSARNARQGAGGSELLDGGDGVRVGEEPVIAVVGGAAGCIENPPGGFQGDPIGIGEVDGADGAVVDDVGDLAVGALQPLPQIVERILVGKIECQVVELGGARGRARRPAW